MALTQEQLQELTEQAVGLISSLDPTKLNELLDKACELLTTIEADLEDKRELDAEDAQELKTFFFDVVQGNEEDTGWKADLEAQDSCWGRNKI